VFCRPQRLGEDDAKTAKMSDASVTCVVNYIPSLDAANHLISLFKTPVGALGGNSINDATHIEPPVVLHAPTAESTHPMKQASAPTAQLAKGNA
jgi:hypothetical protein